MKAFEVKFGPQGIHDAKKIKVNASDYAQANQLVKINYSSAYKTITSFVEVTYVETIQE